MTSAFGCARPGLRCRPRRCAVVKRARRVPHATGPPFAHRPGQAVADLVRRLRPTIAAAAAPKRSIIGGAGTGAGGPPLDPVLPPELLDELEEDELELLLEDELVLEEPKPVWL